MDPKGKRNGCSALLMMTAIDAFLMAQCHVMEAQLQFQDIMKMILYYYVQ